MTKPRKPRPSCPCPLYCLYCGRPRSRDAVGHYCKTPNCQWQHAYSTCVKRDARKEAAK